MKKQKRIRAVKKLFAALLTVSLLLCSVPALGVSASALTEKDFKITLRASTIVNGEVTVTVCVPACKIACLVTELAYDSAVVTPITAVNDEDGKPAYSAQLCEGINGMLLSGMNINTPDRFMLGFMSPSNVILTKTTDFFSVKFKVDDSMMTQTEISLAIKEITLSENGDYTESVFGSGTAVASCDIDRFPKLGGSVTVSDTTPAVGQTLTANTENVTPANAELLYQWYRGTAVIDGATGKTYTVTVDDYGSKLKVVVSPAQPDYTGTRESSPTVAVAAAVLGGTVSISGELVLGATLTANTDNLTPSDVTEYSYQWYRNNTKISGATSKTYVPVRTDVGKTLKVTVGSKQAFCTGTVTGRASAAIASGKEIASDVYTISNTLMRGVPAGTKVSEILANITPVTGVKAYDINGREISASAVIGTGCTLRLMNGLSVADEVTVVVKGDLNADGKVEAADARLALRAATSLENLTPAQNAAGAISGGAKPTATDARTILRVATKLENF